MTFQSLVICGRWLDWCTRNDSMWHDFVLGDFRARLRLEVRSADAWLGADGRSEMEKPLRRRRQNLVLCGPGGEPGSLGFLKDHSATTPHHPPSPESRVSNCGISISYFLYWLTEMLCIDCLLALGKHRFSFVSIPSFCTPTTSVGYYALLPKNRSYCYISVRLSILAFEYSKLQVVWCNYLSLLFSLADLLTYGDEWCPGSPGQLVKLLHSPLFDILVLGNVTGD